MYLRKVRPGSQEHPALLAPAEADRGCWAGQTVQQARPFVPVDYHGLKRDRRRGAVTVVRLRRSAHVLRDQADHVTAERQKRQDGKRHLKGRLHRTATSRRMQNIRGSAQSHCVRRVLFHRGRSHRIRLVRPSYRTFICRKTKSVHFIQ